MEQGEGVCKISQYIGSKSNASETLPRINISTRLAAKIISEEARNGSSGENVLCSPLSLEFALHMLGAGSKGKTLSQILQFLGSKDYPLHSMEDLNLKSSGIMSVASPFCKSDCNEDANIESSEINRVASPFYESDDEEDNNSYQYREVGKKEKEPELSIANGVWVDQLYKLKPSYKQLMSSIYNARAESVDFVHQADQIVEDINSWVAENTKGLIKEILNRLSPDVMLILVNALYFKGAWSCPFDGERTRDRDFHLLDGSKVSVPFMSNAFEEHSFRAFDGFRVVKLNYQSGQDEQRRFSMLILLPYKNDGLNGLLKKCVSDPEFLNQDFGLKVEAFDYMLLPKFKFSYRINDVRGMMKGLGLTLPFNPACGDLTEIVELMPGYSLRVSKIIHKAIIEVDESGTEAAAVTAEEDECDSCSCYMPPPGIRFIADHPFVFVIKEEITGAIFFVGAVLNPKNGD